MNLRLFVVATFSDPVVAAYGIGTRVFSVVFLPATAVARGVETMTGQNIGANKPARSSLTCGIDAGRGAMALSRRRQSYCRL